MFALDPPPLIALEPRLIVCRVSTALLSLSYASIAGGAAGLANPMVPGPLSMWWLQTDCNRSSTRLSAAVNIGSSAAYRIEAPAVRL